MKAWHLALRAVRTPPVALLFRLYGCVMAAIERSRFGCIVRRVDARALARRFGARRVDAAWRAIAASRYPAWTEPFDPVSFERWVPNARAEIARRCSAAAMRRIELLGVEPLATGSDLDWHRDWKSARKWPTAHFSRIAYGEGDGSDVKVPWEMSRLQWLVPVGQEYLLTGDESLAVIVRDTIINWIRHNRCGWSVNWACTMEPSMRVFVWTWFFHVFKRSRAWCGRRFRMLFLSALREHAMFIHRHLEIADVNGNHFTANAAALVCCGSFFSSIGGEAAWWRKLGWHFLRREIRYQVTEDGVDFEGSVAYHRLVLELFLIAARFREADGRRPDPAYGERLLRMADFAAAYSRPWGTSPLVGDADDGRVLPFGLQPIGDHRYLAELVREGTRRRPAERRSGAAASELIWALGPASIPEHAVEHADRALSAAFMDSGFYVMRSDVDHVFIDCSAVGLRGRGGHGHNDCLSVEISLDGTDLVRDSGMCAYTRSFAERDRLRATARHNTPQVDGLELNPFISPQHIWTLNYQAVPEVRLWRALDGIDEFVGSHRGFAKAGVVPQRSITLDKRRHRVVIRDEFSGTGDHEFSIPLHLDPAVRVEREREESLVLKHGSKAFRLRWGDPARWSLDIGECRIFPSYGRDEAARRLVWRRHGRGDVPLVVTIAPVSDEDRDLTAQIPGDDRRIVGAER